MQTMQQQRAAFALERVREAAEDKDMASYFPSYASGLPAMIHMNGLGQAAAFYCSKSGDEKSSPDKRAYRKLYGLLSEWLCRSDQPFAGHNDLLEGITRNDMEAYLLAQAEAQALMDWVKKFASAYMGKCGGQTEEQRGSES